MPSTTPPFLSSSPSSALAVSTVLDYKPLFARMIRRWYEDAVSRRSRSSQTYRLVLDALHACPLPFSHPEQLRQLEGVGPSIVQKVHEELRIWCEQHGRAMPEAAAAPLAAAQRRAKGTGSGQKVGGRSWDNPVDANATGRNRSAPDAAPSSKRKAPAPDPSSSIKHKPKRAYVPQPRSGAHGLLVALYVCGDCLPPSTESLAARFGFQSKSVLIERAQRFSDASFATKAMPPPGVRVTAPMSAFAGAWSSMKTLITRGLVYRAGNPPRFGLSEHGWEVAAICAQREGVEAGSEALEEPSDESRGTRGIRSMDAAASAGRRMTKDTHNTQLESAGGPSNPKGCSADTGQARATIPPIRPRSRPRDPVEKPTQPGSKPVEPSMSPFGYTYLTSSRPPRRTRHRRDAAMRLSDVDYTPTYLVELLSEHRSHPFVGANCERVEADGIRAGKDDVLTARPRDDARFDQHPRQQDGGESSRLAREHVQARSGGTFRAWVREVAANELAPGLAAKAAGTEPAVDKEQAESPVCDAIPSRPRPSPSHLASAMVQDQSERRRKRPLHRAGSSRAAEPGTTGPSESDSDEDDDDDDEAEMRALRRHLRRRRDTSQGQRIDDTVAGTPLRPVQRQALTSVTAKKGVEATGSRVTAKKGVKATGSRMRANAALFDKGGDGARGSAPTKSKKAATTSPGRGATSASMPARRIAVINLCLD